MAASVSIHRLAALDAAARAGLLKRAEADLDGFLDRVRPIIEAVKAEGDVALARFAREFDKAEVDPGAIAATPADFDAAFAAIEPEVREAIEFAVGNIRNFHEAQKPEEMWMNEIRPGAFAGDRIRPIPSVACYVPRGKGSFPSVVMMTTIPAVVAGVKDICVITPPGPGGGIDAATLVAARLAGVDKVYKCGGAQGIAAVAYGTATVGRYAKMVGPGSPFVVAAKRLLADVIDPGIPAGPSEAIILADGTADGRIAALDLLIEAEHGPDSSAFLVTDSEDVAAAAAAALPGYWARMGDAARRILPGRAVRAARRHRPRARFRRRHRLRQRLCARASGDPVGRALRPSRPHRQRRRDPARPPHAGDARQFRARPGRRAADRPRRGDAFAALGVRLHEAHLGRLRHRGGLSRARPPCPRARPL